MSGAGLLGRRKLSQGEVDMIVAAHERFVSGRPGGKRASLRFVDMSDCALSGRNLADADISASILDGAKLIGTKLDRATLFAEPI